MSENGDFSRGLSRRSFLISSSCFGAALATARLFALPPVAQNILQDKRVAAQPLIDKGFAAVRQIGAGVYATISDVTKGFTTVSNGGFIVGREAALLIEGFSSAAGAAFQFEALRSASQLPVRAALDTHYHFDHSMGNSFYGDHDIPIFAHAKTTPLMVEKYANLQGQDKAAIFAPLEKSVQDAKNETERQHATSDLNAYKTIFGVVDKSMVGLPNHPLDPSKLPMKLDLGGTSAVIETYPGHTPTDLIVRVPEQNVVYTGDLLFNGWYPVTFDAGISGWRATLQKFAAFSRDTLFVPGHGQICGQEGVARLRAVFDDLAQHTSKMYKAGVPVEEAQKRYVVPEQFKNFVIFAWGLTVVPTIAKLYEEFKAGTA